MGGAVRDRGDALIQSRREHRSPTSAGHARQVCTVRCAQPGPRHLQATGGQGPGQTGHAFLVTLRTEARTFLRTKEQIV